MTELGGERSGVAENEAVDDYPSVHRTCNSQLYTHKQKFLTKARRFI